VFAYLPLAHILELVMELSVLSRGGAIAYGELRTMTDESCVNVNGQKCGDLTLARPTLFAGVPKVYTRTYEAVKSQVAKSSKIKQLIFKSAYNLQYMSLKLFGIRIGLLDRFVFKPIQKKFGGHVRLFLSGGSALSHDVQEFLTVVGGHIIQGYGLTETCCTGMMGHPDDYFQNNIGGPIYGLKIKLRDCAELGYTSKDPLGPSGEVLVSGPSVSNGYYKEPKMTVDSFLDHGEKYFSTGDIARLQSNGTFKIIDRKKDLVKLSHGEYIALGNLESKYSQSGLVEHVCLIANSTLSNPVAIVVKGGGKKNATEKEVLDDFNKIANANKLGPSEKIKEIIMVSGPWTIENKCLTDSMKIKRNEIYKKYADEIKPYMS
jgi:long-chain acyl-CoA synthetase